MSIDARIAGVTVVPSANNPQVRLHLEPRGSNGPGQSTLTIINPPTTDPDLLRGLIGTEIWGSSSAIMVGDRKWANRISLGLIELVSVSDERT